MTQFVCEFLLVLTRVGLLRGSETLVNLKCWLCRCEARENKHGEHPTFIPINILCQEGNY